MEQHKHLGPVHTYPDIFESTTFSFRIQKSPHLYVAYLNRIRLSHAHPMVSGFTQVPCAIKSGIVVANMPCYCCCAAILVYCSVRDWKRIRHIIGLENIRIHPSTRYQIRSGLIYFFSTLESGFKNVRICCRFHRMSVDGSRIRKEKVRIQRYPDTCGRGLKLCM